MSGDLSFSSSFSLVSEMRWKPSKIGTNYTVDNCQELKFKKECCSQDASQYFILQFPWRFTWDSHQQKWNCLGAVQWLTKLHIPFLVEMKQFMWRIGHMLLVGKVVNSVSTEIPSSRGFSSEWFKAFGNTTYSIVVLTWMTFKSLWMYFFASSFMLWSWL